MKGEHVKGRRNLGNGLPNRADLFPSSAGGQAQRPNRFFLIAYGTPRLIDGGGANGGLPPTAADLGTMQDGPQSTRSGLSWELMVAAAHGTSRPTASGWLASALGGLC